MNQPDREILRALAGRVAEIANQPWMEERRQGWKAFNSLQSSEPKILCFPEGAWVEILPVESLDCNDPLARQWEKTLQQHLFTVETLKDDQPLDPWFNINWVHSPGNYGVEVKETHGDGRGSYVYDSPLKELPEDLEKLSFRQPRVDRKETMRRMELATEIFGDLLPPRIRGSFWWTMGLTWEAIKLIGLEELMIAPYDQPQELHRLMAWLRDEHLHFIQWFEKEGLLSEQNESDYVGSGGIGWTEELPVPGRDPDGPVRLIDRWGFAESQETVGISPAMFQEFIFPYQLPLLEKFGLNYYGCCEPLEKRMEDVLRIPRLRRVSVSPWADVEKMAAYLGSDYIFSRKPNPAPVCVDFHEDVIRKDLRDTLEKAGNCRLEFILKDTHTVQNDPRRLARWVQIAREELATAACTPVNCRHASRSSLGTLDPR